MENRLKSVMTSILNVEIHEDISTENEEKWDSLAHMKLIIALEEEFKTEIAAEDILRLLSYQKIKDYFAQRHLGEDI